MAIEEEQALCVVSEEGEEDFVVHQEVGAADQWGREGVDFDPDFTKSITHFTELHLKSKGGCL